MNIEYINYSGFFNNSISAYQVLFNNSFNSLPLDQYRQSLIDDFPMDLGKLAIPDQIHSNRVKWVDQSGHYKNIDGLITNNNEITLSLQTADCMPIFIFDRTNKIKGLIHSGWRGTKEKIINNAINLMLEKESKLVDIFIVIGASIQKCCYEVGKEFIDYFNNNCIYHDKGKLFFSLQEQIITDLRKLNIPQENIYIDNECTYTNSKLSSYRRDKGEAGTMISFLGNY